MISNYKYRDRNLESAAFKAGWSIDKIKRTRLTDISSILKNEEHVVDVKTEDKSSTISVKPHVEECHVKNNLNRNTSELKDNIVNKYDLGKQTLKVDRTISQSNMSDRKLLPVVYESAPEQVVNYKYSNYTPNNEVNSVIFLFQKYENLSTQFQHIYRNLQCKKQKTEQISYILDTEETELFLESIIQDKNNLSALISGLNQLETLLRVKIEQKTKFLSELPMWNTINEFNNLLQTKIDKLRTLLDLICKSRNEWNQLLLD